MNSLTWERIYPGVLALICAGAWWHFGHPFPTARMDAFLSAALTYAAILIGFMSTAQTLIIGMPVMGALKSSGYLDVLLQYMRWATHSLIFFSVLNLLGFFLPTDAPLWFQGAWILVGVFSLAAFYRVTSILLKIMRRP